MDWRDGAHALGYGGEHDPADLDVQLHRQQVRQVLNTPEGFGYFVRLLSRLRVTGAVDATPEGVTLHNLGEELLSDIFLADHSHGLRVMAALREPEPSGVLQ